MQDQLKLAIQLIESGNTADARDMLRQLTEQDPTNEAAWMWLASVAETQSERVDALVAVVALNPNNQKAKSALEQLGHTVKQTTEPVQTVNPSSSDRIPRNQSVNDLPSKEDLPFWQRMLGGLLLAVFMLGTFSIMMNLLNSGGDDDSAPEPTIFIRPTFTATEGPPPTATNLPRPTNTPGPSPTPFTPSTLAPTWTPQPSLTSRPTRTLAPSITPFPTRTLPPPPAQSSLPVPEWLSAPE